MCSSRAWSLTPLHEPLTSRTPSCPPSASQEWGASAFGVVLAKAPPRPHEHSTRPGQAPGALRSWKHVRTCQHTLPLFLCMWCWEVSRPGEQKEHFRG